MAILFRKIRDPEAVLNSKQLPPTDTIINGANILLDDSEGIASSLRNCRRRIDPPVRTHIMSLQLTEYFISPEDKLGVTTISGGLHSFPYTPKTIVGLLSLGWLFMRDSLTCSDLVSLEVRSLQEFAGS